MKERPIIFSGEMVKAILDGRKTMTRRVVKWKPRVEGLNLQATSLQVGDYCTGAPQHGLVLRSRDGNGTWNDRTFPIHCPYGKPGDRLWVRETWQVRSDGKIEYKATDKPSIETVMRGWKSSIHIRREFSRITLEITAVRVERLQDISEDDARDEGVECRDLSRPFCTDAFEDLWEKINGKKHPWASNPWVWVLEFKKL